MSLRFRLVAVNVAILFVVLMVETVFMSPLLMRYHREPAESALSDIAERIADGFQFTFASAKRELEVAATLPDIASLNKSRLDRVLAMMDRTSGFFNYHFVIDPSGRWISFPGNPSVVGSRIPERNMGWVRRVIEEDHTVILDVVETEIGTSVTGFATPIHDIEGRPVAVLRGVIVTSGENAVLSMVRNAIIDRGGYAFVVSASGRLLAHPRVSIDPAKPDSYDYSSFEPVRRVLRGDAGVVEYESEGVVWTAAYAPIEATGWGVVVQKPKEEIVAFAMRETRFLVGFIWFTFVVSAVVIAISFSRSLRPLGNLLRAVKERRIDSSTVFGSDEIGRLSAEFHALYSDLAVSEEALRAANDELEERVRERTSELLDATRRLSDEVAERERAQEGLRASLGEKELLLKEVHHRVKNNLQVIVSLLRLQGAAFDDERARRVFRECQNRIQAMSLVHERLYQSSDFARVSLDHYIRQLVRGIVSSYGPTAARVSVHAEVEGVTLPIDTAIPCGFIINELVTNAIVHAFPDGRTGSVRVALREVAAETFELVVSDDGVGMPAGLQMNQLDTLGLYLVQTISRDQLRGSVDIVSPGQQGGTDVVVRFGLINYAERF